MHDIIKDIIVGVVLDLDEPEPVGVLLNRECEVLFN